MKTPNTPAIAVGQSTVGSRRHTEVPHRLLHRLSPRIDLELTVLQNDGLLRRVESGHLDLAFVTRNAGTASPKHGTLVRRDHLVWAAAEGVRVDPDRPVPLVVYQTPSLSRAVSVKALEQVGRGSRITCTVRGVDGVLAAVRAGLGVAVFARTLMPPDLVHLPSSVGLPELPHLDLVLLTNPGAPAEPAQALTEAILASGVPLNPITVEGAR